MYYWTCYWWVCHKTSKPTNKVSQLENLKCTLAISWFALQLAVVYKHTQSTENGLKTRIFQESIYGWTMSDGMLIVFGCLTITLYGWTMSDGMLIVCGCLTITIYGWIMSDGMLIMFGC